METSREIKVKIYKTFNDNQRNIIKDIYHNFEGEQLSDLSCILQNTPDGIKCPQRFYQAINHNELKDTGIKFSDIDGYSRYKVKSDNIWNYCFLEMKVNNIENDFNNWYQNAINKREMFEHIIDCNTKTFDKFVYATHDIPYDKSVLLSELIIRKVYVKINLFDEKGQWIDDYNGLNYLEFLKLMKDN